MNLHLRYANISDYKAIKSLIELSARTLGAEDYSAEQIEGALKAAFGLDKQLITDQTYFVVETERSIVGCGGWSYRQTLFGSDAEQNRNSNRINPESGAAKIRAFFVSPVCSRMGIGSMILHRCEVEAFNAGFRKLELMATLPGIRLYEKRGFVADKPIQYPVGGQLTIEFIPMHKEIPVVG
jgi:N-acetylglutamate synthase-like GNAT family acetyltransferase